MDLANLTLFVVSCGVLILAGTLVVKSLARLADFLKMSEFIFAFVIAGLASSLPELFVSISASLANQPAIALGTVIGSNIANVTIVVGIAALLGKGLHAKAKIINRDAYWMVFIVGLVVVLMFIGRELSRLDGLVLLVALVIYLIRLLRQRHKYKARFSEKIGKWAVIGYVALFLIGMPALYFSAEFVVKSGTQLALDLLLPPIFVGLFFIAIGTSLPELVIESRAVLSGRHRIALGDIMGSVIWNSTLVLGVASLINPISSNLFLFLTSSVFMVFACLLFAVFLEGRNMVTWKEGAVLILMYVLFIIVEFTLKNYYMVNGLV